MSEMPLVSMDKQYKTDGGEQVVLYCVDAPGTYKVHGRIHRGNESVVSSWLPNGRRSVYENFHSTDDLVEDLAPAPKTVTVRCRALYRIGSEDGKIVAQYTEPTIELIGGDS